MALRRSRKPSPVGLTGIASIFIDLPWCSGSNLLGQPDVYKKLLKAQAQLIINYSYIVRS